MMGDKVNYTVEINYLLISKVNARAMVSLCETIHHFTSRA